MKNSTQDKITATSIAVGAGAALMFFLDPSRGKKRRALVHDKAAKFARQGGRLLAKAGRDLGHRTGGVLAEARSRVAQVAPPDDVVLSERIRSKLGRLASYPSAIDVLVTSGKVTLRGDVLQTGLDRLLLGIRDVPGVRKVRNELRLHRTTEGVPALRGSQRGSGDSRVRQAWRTPGARMLVGVAGSALTLYGARKQGTLAKLLCAVGLGLVGSELASMAKSERPRKARANINSNAPASPQSIEQERLEIAAKQEEWK